MNLNQVLATYDSMFGKNSMQEIDAYLTNQIQVAFSEKDSLSALSLLSEMTSFCRDTSQKEKGIETCKQLLELMAELDMTGTLEYATALLNIASACRAFGMLQESLAFFEEVERVYLEKLEPLDYRFAGLYNNWALLYQEMGNFREAESKEKKALALIDQLPDTSIQRATTRSNLATTLLQLSQELEKEGNLSDAEKTYREALDYLQDSIARFEKEGGDDYHFGSALAAMGDAYFIKKEYEKSVPYYERALSELLKNMGKGEYYRRVKEHLTLAKKAAGILTEEEFRRNLDRCRAFYETYGRPLIQTKYAQYESRIAVGLVGEGSDCFGFDDAISSDHDYGIGFCMWVTREDFAQIGESLQRDYLSLIREYGSREQETVDPHLQERRGVFIIEDFYGNLLNLSSWEEDFDESTWLTISEHLLACGVNGEVYRDDLGEFTRIRRKLMAHYPEKVRRMRLAKALHEFSQNAQSNYARMMAREDYVTASLCVAQALKSAMEILYLLKKTYAPYYKWMRKGLEMLDFPAELLENIDRIACLPLQKDSWKGKKYSPYELNTEDAIVVSLEKLARDILNQMQSGTAPVNLGTAPADYRQDPFLDLYSQELLKNPEGKEEQMEQEKEVDFEELVDTIVKMEWKQFDKVRNEGGRASCQDNWETFSIMRKSQYLAWPMELVQAYLRDLIDADSRGWNMIMEKYGRMMESTVPEKYAQLSKEFPEINERRKNIQETIIAIQVEWMEEFATRYPNLAGNARSIHTTEDTPYNTSYETYLRGEISTYSEYTLFLYGQFIVSLKQQGENLAQHILQNTAHLYGYHTIESAEEGLKANPIVCSLRKE